MSPRLVTNTLDIAKEYVLIKLMINQGVMNMLARCGLKNVKQGAATICYLALHPQVSGISGEFFMDGYVAKASSQGRDIDLAKKLWDYSMNLTEQNT
ncbi:hypothetical protein AHAS_Ahas15G0401100 [Arachis hypogaea]